MPLTRKLAICLAALSAVTGCHRQKPQQPEEPPPPFMLDDAMQHWYGRYDPPTRTARANLPEHPSIELAGSFFAPRDPVDIVVIFDAAYTQTGHPRHVIVTAAVPHRSDKPGRPGDDLFHCLLCRPVIGMAVFTLRGRTWLLESENPAVDLAGSMGNAPQVHLVELGMDLHGVRLDSRFNASDEENSSTSLLAPWREAVVLAFAAQTAGSNRGACGPESPMRDACYAWQRALAFVAVPGQQYDDLTVTTSGTQLPPEPAEASPLKPARLNRKGQPPPSEPQAIPFAGVERLRFRNGRYMPLASDEEPAR